MVQDTNQMSREVLNKVTKQGQQWMGIEMMQKGVDGCLDDGNKIVDSLYNVNKTTLWLLTLIYRLIQLVLIWVIQQNIMK